jgi:hypothetical protein
MTGMTMAFVLLLIYRLSASDLAVRAAAITLTDYWVIHYTRFTGRIDKVLPV